MSPGSFSRDGCVCTHRAAVISVVCVLEATQGGPSSPTEHFVNWQPPTEQLVNWRANCVHGQPRCVRRPSLHFYFGQLCAWPAALCSTSVPTFLLGPIVCMASRVVFDVRPYISTWANCVHGQPRCVQRPSLHFYLVIIAHNRCSRHIRNVPLVERRDRNVNGRGTARVRVDSVELCSSS